MLVHTRYDVTCFYFFLVYSLSFMSAQMYTNEKIAVGAIFDQNTEEIQNVFKYAMTQHNQNVSSRGRLELQAYVDVINTADAFKLSRLICNQFARGVWSMLGAVTPDSFDTLHSYTNTFQMPFVTPWFPEKVIPPSSGLIDHAVSMRPDYHKAVADIILHYGWKEIMYIYDSHDGLLRLQQLYQLIQPGRAPFRITMVKRISNASDAIEFFLALEQHDRWGSKRIVIDCSAKLAKSVLVAHVRNINLGRRTYHYLMSGLVMDDYWENDVLEYGAVNITGFRIIDHSRKIVKDFMDGLRKMDPKAKDNNNISAQAALMFDGVQVLIDALAKLWRKKPDVFRNSSRRSPGQINATKIIDCNPGKSWVVPFEHGDKISRMIKKTEIEGLTGNISFNDEGRRHNFTLQIVEMTTSNDLVKIGSWSDKEGLMITHQRADSTQFGFELNKTLIVATVLQAPYMMLSHNTHGSKNEDYYGFCKDLIEHISKEIGFKYKLHVTRDGEYGKITTFGRWDGVLGELIRKEADIALAALAVTDERTHLISFVEPFDVVECSTNQEGSKSLTDSFSFMKPLSKEIWMCIVFSFFAVSIVLFLVSRFSPQEWKSMSISDTQGEHSAISTNEIILHNDFSIWNSFWFSLGSFMQQGSDVVPRSLSGRIVGTVWWFFALILVCSYTANLAAYLIVERITEQNEFLDQFTTRSHETHTSLCRDILKSSRKTTNQLIESTASEGLLSCNKLCIDCEHTCIELAMATQINSPLSKLFSTTIMDMKKNGLLLSMKRNWLFHHNPTKSYVKKEEMTVAEISLSQVAGIFYVLVLGLIVALGVALFEFCMHGRAEAVRANVTLRAALRNEARSSSRNDKSDHLPPRQRNRLGWNGTSVTGYFAAGHQISREDMIQAGFTHV